MSMSKEGKKVELEDLARMVQAGFADVQGKMDKRSKLEDERFKITVEEFDRIRSDIRDIKTTLGPLARSVMMMEEDLSDLRLRVGTLERRAGIKKNISFAV